MVYANVISFSHTATDDLLFRLCETHMWFREANIHIVTNNALYGDLNTQAASATTNDVISFQDFDLSQLYFKNAGAGSNTTIHVVGILMSASRKRSLEIPKSEQGD